MALRVPALVSSVALALSGVGAALAPAASADPSTVTLVGSLQDEAGCPVDWDPTCGASELTATADGSAYAGVFELPAGSYEAKVTVGNSWEVNYGLGGAADGANIPVVLSGDAAVLFSFDAQTHVLTMTPADPAGGTTKADRALAADSLREPLTRERFYFVMADRFANGDPDNDTGGWTGGRLESGFDPTDKGFYHGGDLAGIIDHLDYIEDLGTTAIWLTPSFKNRPVQGSGDDVSAGYHGYWITDFTQIDPHLGTNDEMRDLIDAAHDRGMKVFFDIITNHTADVINYAEGQYSYISKEDEPYTDASGEVFDDKDYAGGDTFPTLDPQTSFPYTPIFNTEADAGVKVPAWLNDRTLYHNRGDSTFAGESSEYGDFVGLDDLFTERPEVVDGMGEIYQAWVDLGIDGFRIDTVKHVNIEFWQDFGPRLLDHAAGIGNDDFFMFGEVYDSRPDYLSTFTTTGRLQATLDFGFQTNAVQFAQGKPATALADFFAADDWYTDADSNVYQTPTFLGNHDMGRVAMMLAGVSADEDDLLSRVRLANDLMYLTRGQPITYYGDEQGFIGSGGDKDARQDMFATSTQQYAAEPVLAAPSGSMDRYDRTHPVYEHIAELSALREEHPALADGAQVTRYADEGEGIFAFSRIDVDTGVEYLVAVNNATAAASATFPTANAKEKFSAVYGTSGSMRSAADTTVTVRVPGRSAVVYRAGSKVDPWSAAPELSLTSPVAGATVGGRAQIAATLTDDAWADVTFYVRPVGTDDWQLLGTDDNAPYRVFHDTSALAKGTLVEYRAVAQDYRGTTVVADSGSGVVGDAPGNTGGGDGPVVQPDFVSVPGFHNDEMGCAADWMPDCDQAQLDLDPQDGIWKKTYAVPEGTYSYKVAINKSWDENYGVGAVPGGDNIPYTSDGTVSFYYDHGSHWVTSNAQGPIVTAPGSFQDELGCSADWLPDCMRPWLQDPDGDGTYEWSTTAIPAGSYEFKVTEGLSWAVNYGAGGVADGPNVPVVVGDGQRVTFSYDSATHEITATVTAS